LIRTSPAALNRTLAVAIFLFFYFEYFEIPKLWFNIVSKPHQVHSLLKQ